MAITVSDDKKFRKPGGYVKFTQDPDGAYTVTNRRGHQETKVATNDRAEAERHAERMEKS